MESQNIKQPQLKKYSLECGQIKSIIGDKQNQSQEKSSSDNVGPWILS